MEVRFPFEYKSNPTDEWKETREHTLKAVVRMFLFQSRSPEMLADTADPKTVEFVDTILLRKSGDNNPNQLMPVGGKIDDNETMAGAIRRELLEETHLRAVPNSVTPFTALQNYSFAHTSEKHGGNSTQKRRRVYFYQGRILPNPHDVPYALDQAEDKIANFEQLSLQQCRELLSTGRVTTPHGPTEILESLNPNPDVRSSRNVETDQVSVQAVHEELLLSFQHNEMRKKLSVLQELLQQSQDPRAKTDLLEVARLEQSSDAHDFIQQTEQFWQTCVERYNWTMADVKRGLGYSNLHETLDNAAEKFDITTGKGVPTVDLIFPLLFSGKFDRRKYEVLSKNPETAKLLKMTTMLHRYNKFVQAGRPETIAVDLRQRLHTAPDADIDVDTIRQWMYQEKILGKEFQDDFYTLSPQIDRYFEKLHEEAHITEFSIDQANQVKNVPLEKLLELIFSQSDPLLRWEAERKITLLYMLHEASTIWKRVQKRGVEVLDGIESSLESPHSKVGHRMMHLDGVDHPVKIERRTKTLMSLLRKLIVRDRVADVEDIVGDIHAESYIFTDPNTDDSEQTFTSPCLITDGSDRLLTEFTTPKIIGDLIMGIAEKATAQGAHIEIVKYKAPPKPGEKFASSGPGGGGDVHFGKFYIKHTDAKGIVRFREVQVFIPRTVKGKRQSGEVDYIYKKEEDKQYAVRRLFSTPGLRSFMELLYPAEIYGDSIQPIYSGKVKQPPAPKPIRSNLTLL